jgi:transposase
LIPHGVEVFVGLDPVDLRWGFERLAGLVTAKVGRDARSGALFVFFGKRRHAVKVLFFDGTGMCLFYKRLDKGAFRIPAAAREGATALAIDERALDDLLDGIDLDSAPAKAPRRSTTH